jgi:hypothetical protein
LYKTVQLSGPFENLIGIRMYLVLGCLVLRSPLYVFCIDRENYVAHIWVKTVHILTPRYLGLYCLHPHLAHMISYLDDLFTQHIYNVIMSSRLTWVVYTGVGNP